MARLVALAVDVTTITDGVPNIAKVTPVYLEPGVGEYLDDTSVFTYDLASETVIEDMSTWYDTLDA